MVFSGLPYHNSPYLVVFGCILVVFGFNCENEKSILYDVMLYNSHGSKQKITCPKVQIFCENKAAAAERGKVLEEKGEEGEKVKVVQDHILNILLARWMNLFYFYQEVDDSLYPGG